MDRRAIVRGVKETVPTVQETANMTCESKRTTYVPDIEQPQRESMAIESIMAQCMRSHRTKPLTHDRAWIVIDDICWDMEVSKGGLRRVSTAVRLRLRTKEILIPPRPRMATLEGNAARDYSTWGKRFREMLNHKRQPKKMGRVTKTKRETLEGEALREALSMDLKPLDDPSGKVEVYYDPDLE